MDDDLETTEHKSSDIGMRVGEAIDAALKWSHPAIESYQYMQDYPIAQLAAPEMAHYYRADPLRYGQALKEVMAKGANISLEDAGRALLGNNHLTSPHFFAEAAQRLAAERHVSDPAQVTQEMMLKEKQDAYEHAKTILETHVEEHAHDHHDTGRASLVADSESHTSTATNQTHSTIPSHLRNSRLATQSGANNGLGVAMGAYGIYEKLHNENSGYNRDIRSGDAIREITARTGLAVDATNIAVSGVATAADGHALRVARAPTPQAAASHPNAIQNMNGAKETVEKAVKVVEETAEQAAHAADDATRAATTSRAAANAARFGTIGKVAGRAAIPLALAAGGAETYAATRAGDRDRATGAVGGTAGGILGGIAVGAAAGALMGGTAGSVVPGVGTIAVGVVAGIAGGIGGAFVGEAAAKRYASGAVGWLTGIDGKLEAAAKGVDARLKPFLDKNHNGKIDADELHGFLKCINKDSIDKLDRNHDGKLTSAELNVTLKAAVGVTELAQKLKELEAHQWGKVLGNKDGKLTINEVVAAFPKGFDFLSLDKNHNGDISGKEITDALKAMRQPAVKPSTQRH